MFKQIKNAETGDETILDVIGCIKVSINYCGIFRDVLIARFTRNLKVTVLFRRGNTRRGDDG